ncbi:MAG: hypothetical protein LBK71_09995 [Verrucomicrobiales bacterium]|nr:hypothetical protein [Verrucomicrobiales bacterium]
MANEAALDSKTTSFYMPLELHKKLQREARRLRISVNALVTFILESELKRRGVELTAEDYEEIARQVRKNEKRRLAARHAG